MAKKTEEQQVNTEMTGLDFSAHAGEGFDNVTVSDIGLPFLKMLQKMSPEVDKTMPEYVAGAEQGDIFNTLTKELYKDGIEVVHCNFRKESIEWVPQEKGGGLKGIHAGDTELWNNTTVDDKGRSILPNGNQLSLTANHYVLYKDKGGEYQCAIIALSGTQLKKSKQWLGRMAQVKLEGPNGKFTPPTFSQFWVIKPIGESNEKGSWMGWDINPKVNENKEAVFLSDKDLFRRSLEFNKSIQEIPRLSVSSGEAKQLASAVEEKI